MMDRELTACASCGRTISIDCEIVTLVYCVNAMLKGDTVPMSTQIAFHMECFKEAGVQVSWEMGASGKNRGRYTEHLSTRHGP